MSSTVLSRLSGGRTDGRTEDIYGTVLSVERAFRTDLQQFGFVLSVCVSVCRCLDVGNARELLASHRADTRGIYFLSGLVEIIILSLLNNGHTIRISQFCAV